MKYACTKPLMDCPTQLHPHYGSTVHSLKQHRQESIAIISAVGRAEQNILQMRCMKEGKTFAHKSAGTVPQPLFPTIMESNYLD